MKRKRRKRRTGSSLLSLLLCGLLVSAAASGKKKEDRQPVAVAVIAGTVFRPPGLALPDATVRIRPDREEAAGIRLKKADAVANTRGEFAFRVPAVPATWTVNVHVKGYKDQSKTVTVEAEQRFDLSFLLEPGVTKGDSK